jgi:hypothetical protein
MEEPPELRTVSLSFAKDKGPALKLGIFSWPQRSLVYECFATDCKTQELSHIVDP